MKQSGHTQKIPFRLLLMTLFIAPPLVLALLYLWSPVYRFPESRPFSGVQWYNPYEEMGSSWLRCNFHVHSRNWFGLTQGVNHPEDIRTTYGRMGYDILSISDYQHITPSGYSRLLDIPVYEHGYNPGKVHQIVLGARETVWLDYPLGQGLHQKQHVINRLKETSEFVILAHPALYNGYRPKELAKLGGYDAVEALNHFCWSLELWDAALSAGRAVWLFGGDDSHDVSIAGETGVRWTMVNTDSKKRRPLFKALRKGAFYAASGRRGRTANQLNRISLEKHRDEATPTLRIAASLPADIRFIGQGGKVRHTVSYASEANLLLTLRDTYIRVEILRADGSLYLNPVIRWNGQSLPNPQPETDLAKTWLKRLGTLMALAAGGWFVLSRRLRRSRNTPVNGRR